MSRRKPRPDRKRWKGATTDELRYLHRRSWYRKKYDMEVEDYDAMLVLQGGRCAICHTDTPGGFGHGHFYVDHCHSTGRVRALLCHHCNTGLGHFKDDPDLLSIAAYYIQQHREPVV